MLPAVYSQSVDTYQGLVTVWEIDQTFTGPSGGSALDGVSVIQVLLGVTHWSHLADSAIRSAGMAGDTLERSR